LLLYTRFLQKRSECCSFIISVIVKILTNFRNCRLPGHGFWKNGHGKSWKSHGILNGRRCTNPDYTYTGSPCLRYLFQVVQTRTTTAYCRILPTLDLHVFYIVWHILCLELHAVYITIQSFFQKSRIMSPSFRILWFSLSVRHRTQLVFVHGNHSLLPTRMEINIKVVAQWF
jgi:hypothetical protein